jgi:hypothetical protein
VDLPEDRPYVSPPGRAAPVLGLDVGPHTVSAGIDDLAGLTLAPPDVRISGLAEDTILTGALRLALDEVWHQLN